MTTDSTDWSLFGGNPIPGDPDGLRSLAADLGDSYDTVNGQGLVLRNIRDSMGNAVWSGEAADAFKPHVDDMPDKLDKVARSFHDAGSALDDFWPRLAGHQTEARAALVQATTAHQNLTDAHSHLSQQQAASKQAADAAKSAGKPAPTPDPGAHDYSGDVSSAQSAFDAAVHRKDNAVTAWQQDVATCGGRIQDAAFEGIAPKKHHWWDTAYKWAQDHIAPILKVISRVANAISGICAILALVTCWCPALSAAFESASLITGAIGLVADLGLLALNRGSLTDVLTDAVGVATAGAGHLFAAGGDAIRAGEEGAATATKAEKAASTAERSATKYDKQAESYAKQAAHRSNPRKVAASEHRAQQATENANRQRTAAGDARKVAEKGREEAKAGETPLKTGAGKTRQAVNPARNIKNAEGDTSSVKGYVKSLKPVKIAPTGKGKVYQAAGVGLGGVSTVTATNGAADGVKSGIDDGITSNDNKRGNNYHVSPSNLNPGTLPKIIKRHGEEEGE